MFLDHVVFVLLYMLIVDNYANRQMAIVPQGISLPV